ncbi:MAG: NnrU family protein, partial [Rhodospirillaceae bacterium]
MTGTLPQLAAAVGMFVASHIVMAWAPVRGPLAARFGRWGFMAMYSGVSAALLGWAIQAYAAAPVVVLTEPGTALKHGALTLMLIATFFIVAGYTTPNPGIMGMEQVGLRSGARGVLKITRHPVMWGVALWGIAHALANGHVAAWLFFGGMTVLALAGAAHIDAKRRAQHGDAWIAYQDAT